MKPLKKIQILSVILGLITGVHTAVAGSWTLDKVVTLTRHGVRPQTNTEKLSKATGKQWPSFNVPDGHLTGHGYTGVWQQAAFLLKGWQQEGLSFHSPCPETQQFFLWTGPSQRIKATGKAMADGMFPGCGIHPMSVNAKYGPLFELYHLHQSHPDKAIMMQQIMQRMGSPEEAEKRYKESVALLRKTVCAPDSCQFLEQPWGVKFKSTGKPVLTGPGKMGATIGETVRLQYSDNRPLSQVAFGYGINAKAVKQIMAIHAAQYNLALDTPEFAAHAGSLLMRQILAALTSGTDIKSRFPGDARLNRPLVMFVGHDTNIAEIKTLLGFEWTLPGYPSNDIPPGGTLSLTRFHYGNHGKPYVRVRFSARSLDQWRSLSPLTKNKPLLHTDLNFDGCKNTNVGTLCPLDLVVKRGSRWLVKDGMDLPLFQSN